MALSRGATEGQNLHQQFSARDNNRMSANANRGELFFLDLKLKLDEAGAAHRIALLDAIAGQAGGG